MIDDADLRWSRLAVPTTWTAARTMAHIVDALLFYAGQIARRDASGWAGMAVTELLVHGHDVSRALEVGLSLPEQICHRPLTRVFPWVPLDLGTPDILLLALTGRATVPGIPNDPEWWWQSAPLAEWDGKPRRRTSPPRWL